MNPWKKILQIGFHEGLSAKEKKRVQLLNAFCIITIVANTGLAAIIFSMDQFENHIAVVHSLLSISTFIVLAIHHARKYFAARVGNWLITYAGVFYFSFFGDQSVNNEYYFALLAVLPLMFFDRRWVHYLALGLSCYGFFSMDFYYLAQGVEESHHMGNSSFILFTMLFLIVNYFKKLNEKQEETLVKQRNEAVKQKEVIADQKRELEELNRFQSKFFVNISHELRTPLTLIGGAASQLSKNISSSDQQQVDNILSQSNKIKNIVDDILDITKSKFNKLELNIQQTELEALLQKIYISFLPSFESKEIHFLFQNDTQSGLIAPVDPIHFERVLNNLLLNSLKYTPPKGEVSLSVRFADDQILLAIEDTGIGISEADISRIFDRFYQAENDINRAGGTGVGLSYVKDIIELHQGSIKVSSEEGKGSLFQITLPGSLVPGTSEATNIPKATKSQPTPQPLASSQGKTILIVDDHPDMRQYIASLLTDFQILEANNGEEGLQQLSNHQVDYIITDYMMPVMDGYQFVKELKSREVDVPVLVLTARADQEGKLDILRLGVDDYITKPFNQEELIIRIQNALQNHQERSSYVEEEKIEESVVTENPLIQKIRIFIEERCDNSQFGLDDICDEFALSTSSLYRKVKSLTGLSSNEFVREVKLNKARELVETQQCSSLKELSAQVGFSKTSYFAGLYEKRFGKRPFLN